MVYYIEVVPFHDYYWYNCEYNMEDWVPGHHPLFLARTLNNAASHFKNVKVLF